MGSKMFSVATVFVGITSDVPAMLQFPVQTESTSKTETVSAFGELNLVKNNMKQYSTELQQSFRPSIIRNTYQAKRNPDESLDSVVRFSRDEPLLDARENDKYASVYKPTTTRSEASVASTKKSYGKLSEVYSNSGDTVEFAHNLGGYLTSVVPPYVWIALFIILALWGMVLILVGSFNLPFCSLQPMIPIYLIVTGSLFFVLSAIRVYSLWPMPATARPSSLGITLVCRSIEALVVLAIFVWLILGSIWTFGGPKLHYVHYKWGHYPETYLANHYCDKETYWMALVSIFVTIAIVGFGVLAIIFAIFFSCIWVYGKRSTYHSGADMFERHYCDPGTYWVAFASISLQLGLIALALLLGAIIVGFGLWKETDETNMTQA